MVGEWESLSASMVERFPALSLCSRAIRTYSLGNGICPAILIEGPSPMTLIVGGRYLLTSGFLPG